MTHDDSSSEVTLLAAMPMELAPLRRPLGLKRIGPGALRGEYRGCRICGHVLGVGRKHALASLERILQDEQPRWIVHLGLAGGLSPELRTGEVVHIAQVMAADAPAIRLTDSRGAGTLFTADAPVTTAAEKARLARATAAQVVDMETYPLAARLHEMENPPRYSAVRAVSDPAHRALPAEIGQTLRADGSANVGGVIRMLLRRPQRAVDLFRLARDSHNAAHRLAQAVVRLIDDDLARGDL